MEYLPRTAALSSVWEKKVSSVFLLPLYNTFTHSPSPFPLTSYLCLTLLSHWLHQPPGLLHILFFIFSAPLLFLSLSPLVFQICFTCFISSPWVKPSLSFSFSPLSLGVEYVHQCGQAAGGGRAAGPDGRVRPGGDLPGRPPTRGQDPRLCSPRGAAQSPAGHVCRLPHARQRGRQAGSEGDSMLEWMVGCVLVWMRASTELFWIRGK